MFIVFEGLDGAGKSTQIKKLEEWLVSLGYNVLVTREPGGCQISEQIREIILDSKNTDMQPMAECYLYAAARAQLVRQVIRPALESGKIVLCDRFLASSLAYQGFARGLGEETVLAVNKIAVDGVYPDLTVFFDMPFDHQRVGADKDRMESSGDDFFDKVYQGYKNLYHTGVVVDARQSIEEIAEKIKCFVKEKLDEQTN